jgi:hypothetical protein
MWIREETQNNGSGKALDEASGQSQTFEQRAKADREADREAFERIDREDWRGMNFSLIAADERVLDVAFTDDALSVSLHDGRVISVPLVWYLRLLNATPAQRKNCKVAGGGYGIHWPDIDEDLSTEGLLRGAKAPHAR